ncbi:MAG: leucine dehydrogenase [Defluviitaleaceae bacterium]|nr:leucine dehydrogenase [Defluviitaleaceae bacterium]
MNKFEYMERYGFEQLCFFQDRGTGLKAITCIHNTVLGPALGGTRFWNYADEEAAVEDCLRLARGMTYKSAMAGLALGGGKSVIIGDVKALRKDSIRTEAFWRTFGRYVNGLAGRYITAEDVGTITQDMAYVNMETNYVVGLPGRSGNPAPYTARGVYKSLLACCNHVYGSDSLSGKRVAIQGMGAVGFALAEMLCGDGATIVFSELDDEKAERAITELKATRVHDKDIYSADCDIYAPCALGATINDLTLPLLKCKIICGAANNVLKDAPTHAKALRDRDIIYAPDYVANAGGVINVSYEFAEGGYNETAALRDIDRLYWRIREILKTSDETGQLTYETADQMAEARIEAVRKIKGIYNR